MKKEALNVGLTKLSISYFQTLFSFSIFVRETLNLLSFLEYKINYDKSKTDFTNNPVSYSRMKENI
jgi:hypothetical protein